MNDIIIRAVIEAIVKGEIDLHKQLLFGTKPPQWILSGEL